MYLRAQSFGHCAHTGRTQIYVYVYVNVNQHKSLNPVMNPCQAMSYIDSDNHPICRLHLERETANAPRHMLSFPYVAGNAWLVLLVLIVLCSPSAAQCRCSFESVGFRDVVRVFLKLEGKTSLFCFAHSFRRPSPSHVPQGLENRVCKARAS
jgi:hypothetical protein